MIALIAIAFLMLAWYAFSANAQEIEFRPDVVSVPVSSGIAFLGTGLLSKALIDNGQPDLWWVPVAICTAVTLGGHAYGGLFNSPKARGQAWNEQAWEVSGSFLGALSAKVIKF